MASKKECNDTTLDQVSQAKDNNNAGKGQNNNDFVIRDGFPALMLPGGNKGPWIDGDDVGVASGGLPRHAFWCDESAVEFDTCFLGELRGDCETVFSAQPKEDNEAYSTGQTYFCPCQMQPRCALEALALEIFHSHVQHLEDGVYMPERSGAEWWVLVLDEEKEEKEEKRQYSAEKIKEDDDGDDDDDEIGLHFDADYGLEDQAPNLLLHPRLATVTYISDFGVPTLILEKRSPHPSDVEKKTLEGPTKRGWLSHPKIGKHIAFDGRFLHGAPSYFFPSSDTTEKGLNAKEEPLATKRLKRDQKRVTLLVNIWLNHCPLEADLLDDEICQTLNAPWRKKNHMNGEKDEGAVKVKSSFTWKNPDTLKEIKLEKMVLSANSKKPAGEEVIVLCNREVTVKYGASKEDFHKASSLASSSELEFSEGVIVLEVGDEIPSDEEEEEDNE